MGCQLLATPRDRIRIKAAAVLCRRCVACPRPTSESRKLHSGVSLFVRRWHRLRRFTLADRPSVQTHIRRSRHRDLVRRCQHETPRFSRPGGELQQHDPIARDTSARGRRFGIALYRVDADRQFSLCANRRSAKRRNTGHHKQADIGPNCRWWRSACSKNQGKWSGFAARVLSSL